MTALTAERDQLRGNEDPVRDALRAQVEASRAEAWTEPALAALPEKIGLGWVCDWQVDGEYARVQAVRRNPRLDEWPEYAAFVERWSRMPGVQVESVEIQADGGMHDRRLIRVAFALRFLRDDATSSDANRAVPSHGPARVAPAEGPAAPRTVGPVTSLRRPETSAQPPVLGRLPLCSDPTLRGPRPVLNHKPKTKPT